MVLLNDALALDLGRIEPLLTHLVELVDLLSVELTQPLGGLNGHVNLLIGLDGAGDALRGIMSDPVAVCQHIIPVVLLLCIEITLCLLLLVQRLGLVELGKFADILEDGDGRASANNGGDLLAIGINAAASPRRD